MQPEYAGTITNLKVVLNTHKNPYLNQAPRKNNSQNFAIQKIPKQIFQTRKILRSPLSLEIGSTPLGVQSLQQHHFP